MRGKSLLNEKDVIILSLNQSECRKLLRSASSRIGFSRDTGIEESAWKSSFRPLIIISNLKEICTESCFPRKFLNVTFHALTRDNYFTVIPRNRPILVSFYDAHGDMEEIISSYIPRVLTWTYFRRVTKQKDVFLSVYMLESLIDFLLKYNKRRVLRCIRRIQLTIWTICAFRVLNPRQ